MRLNRTTHAQFNKPGLLYLVIATLPSEMRRTIEPSIFINLYLDQKVDSTYCLVLTTGLEIWCMVTVGKVDKRAPSQESAMVRGKLHATHAVKGSYSRVCKSYRVKTAPLREPDG